MSSPNSSNIVLLAAIGLGGYLFLSQRARAQPQYMPPSNRQGGIMPSAGLATAAGLVQLFGNLPWARGQDPRTVSPGYGKWAGGVSTNAPAWESGDGSDAAFNFGNGFLGGGTDQNASNEVGQQGLYQQG